MNRIGIVFLVAAYLLGEGAAWAQQPPADPRISTYEFLLTESNRRVADMSAQNAVLAKQLEETKAALAKVQQPPEPKKE